MFENEKMYKEYIDGMDKYIHDLNELKKVDPERQKNRQGKACNVLGF